MQSHRNATPAMSQNTKNQIKRASFGILTGFAFYYLKGWQKRAIMPVDGILAPDGMTQQLCKVFPSESSYSVSSACLRFEDIDFFGTGN